VHDLRHSGLRSDCDRYLFAGAVLHGVAITSNPRFAAETFEANFTATVRAIETILDENREARVCVIGSESGFSGSYDMAYAGSKAALHLYVEQRRIKERQQLVCISPSIIEDAGMTIRRRDAETLRLRRNGHPKQRFLKAAEVARMAHFLLYVDEGYTTGVTIRINGGEHAWR
jgi:NAD(P)-dependent dehydrogenase (short-subunit alcohol dehydrogenase family)